MPEWLQIALAVAGAAGLGGAGGVGGALWYVARLEPRMELKVNEKLEALKEALSDKIEASEKMVESRQTEQVEMFRETFAGLRQKISDVELEAERNFVGKDAFADFVGEFREHRREAATRHDKLLEAVRQIAQK